jgi:hypothetical protein
MEIPHTGANHNLYVSNINKGAQVMKAQPNKKRNTRTVVYTGASMGDNIKSKIILKTRTLFSSDLFRGKARGKETSRKTKT